MPLPLHLRVGLERRELSSAVARNLSLVLCLASKTASERSAQQQHQPTSLALSHQRNTKKAVRFTHAKLGKRLVHVERLLRLIDEVDVVGLEARRAMKGERTAL
jgi:hypothetical protein